MAATLPEIADRNFVVVRMLRYIIGGVNFQTLLRLTLLILHHEKPWNPKNPLNENFIYVEDDDDIFEEQINIDPDMNLRVCTDNQCSYIQHEALLNVLKNNSNKDLSLIELNIRSLPKNFASLELLIDQFRDRLHFILLVETWLTSASTDQYGLDGFRFESNYRKKKKGGGTAIYIQDSVMYTSLPKVGRVTDDIETTFIKIDKHNHLLDKDLVLGVCYRPPNGDIDTFLLQITDIFHMLKVHDCYLYIAGDFNLNLLEKSKKHKIDCYFNTLLSYGLPPGSTIQSGIYLKKILKDFI